MCITAPGDLIDDEIAFNNSLAPIDFLTRYKHIRLVVRQLGDWEVGGTKAGQDFLELLSRLILL